MEPLKLEKADFSKIDKSGVLNKATKDENFDVTVYVKEVNEPRYLYWDEVKYKPTPKNLNSIECWFLVKQLRKLLSTLTPIRAESGGFFKWIRLTYTDEYLHEIDMHTGGQIFTTYENLSQDIKQKFLSRGVIEEAIASSQLEGAHTTRAVAKRMILEKRKPRNESERMIMNNYITMSSLEEDFKNRELSEKTLFDLHAMITKDTLTNDKQYRYRKDEDDIVVRNDRYVAFIPPKHSFVEQEIKRLFEYANDKESKEFVHPVIKAIFLHFWIGYLHPFVDGNGRLARALFYWYLLRKGYWTFMYLPISSIIKKSPVQYSMAYTYVEQDDFDLTYFYDYHIRKILQSIEEFDGYVSRITSENKKIDMVLKESIVLNERQKQLLYYLVSERDNADVTIGSHQTLNNISRQTAYRDLKYLKSQGLLTIKNVGKFTHYFPSETLIKLFAIYQPNRASLETK